MSEQMSDLEARLESGPTNVFDKYDPNAVVREAEESYLKRIEAVSQLVGASPDPGSREAELSRLVRESSREALELNKQGAGRYIDTTTGLLSREAFIKELNADIELVRVGERDDLRLYVVDLNNLKLVNDLLGHGAGDEYLRAAGDELKLFARYGHKPARVGGDELVSIEPTGRSDVEAVRVALDTALTGYGAVLAREDARLAEAFERHPLGAAVGQGSLTPQLIEQLGERPSIGRILEISGADADMYEHKRAMKGPGGSYR